eukprot:972131-Prymnesium_polylepis.4
MLALTPGVKQKARTRDAGSQFKRPVSRWSSPGRCTFCGAPHCWTTWAHAPTTGTTTITRSGASARTSSSRAMPVPTTQARG